MTDLYHTIKGKEAQHFFDKAKRRSDDQINPLLTRAHFYTGIPCNGVCLYVRPAELNDPI